MDFIKEAYSNGAANVSWCGKICEDRESFSKFLTNQVRSRLNDTEGQDEVASFLKGLALTGLDKQSLEEVLSMDQPEEKAWVAGEALAEAFLQTFRGVYLPWNMKRDKRNANASLPGTDIVGLVEIDGRWRLAFGEVKSSSELRYPPQVMSGRKGHMGDQIGGLVTDPRVVEPLLYWLISRIKENPYKDKFKLAIASYFNSTKKTVSIFGMLVRDTVANENDLKKLGEELRENLSSPMICELIALYLPWSLEELPFRVQAGDGL
ncbi:MAG: hypothetical protein WCY61_02180 [Sphaerochaeta sp.]